MRQSRRPWRPQITDTEAARGWVFFALYVLVFPVLMGFIQRSFNGLLPVAESNLVYYLLSGTLVLLLLWSFLKHGFHLLLDWLPENLFAMGTGFLGFAVLNFLVGLIPMPVQNPAALEYPLQFQLAPGTTIMILVVLMPLVEEPLFRGLLFGGVRRHSRWLGYLLSTLLFAVYCVWQFAFSSMGTDLRYVLLLVQYLPMSLALTWCYDNGGSIWSATFLHMLINAFHLFNLVH